jgi:hypothetical protein
MANINLIYTIPLPEEMFEGCIDAFARATGWRELVDAPVDYDAEADKIEHSRKKLNEYVNTTITSYQSTAAAEAARTATLEAGSAALGQIATTLVVG